MELTCCENRFLSLLLADGINFLMVLKEGTAYPNRSKSQAQRDTKRTFSEANLAKKYTSPKELGY